MDRRTFLSTTAAIPLAAAFSNAHAQERVFAPRPGDWRTFEITTRLEIVNASATTRAWIPVPAIDGDWQQSLTNTWKGSTREAALHTDGVYGARFVAATWPEGE